MNADREWFLALCAELESAHGHGWKAHLARIIHVSPTNVQSWIKAGRMPPAPRRAYELHLEVTALRVENAALKATLKALLP